MSSHIFAKNLVEDYVNFGYGEKVDDHTIKSLDGSVELEFEVNQIPVSNDSKNAHKELVIYSNGGEVFAEIYELAKGETGLSDGSQILSQEEFSKKLIQTVTAELNV